MNVLFVTQYFRPEIGATQTRLYEFARAAAAAGHRVTVLTEVPNHPHGRIAEGYRGRLFSSERMDGFTVLRVWVVTSPTKTFWRRLAFYGSFFLLASLRGLVVRDRVDLVFASSPPLPVGAVGWVLARRHGARFVLDIRDLWPAAAVALGELRDPKLLRLATLLERALYRGADVVTTVTESFAREIARHVPRERVRLLPNGASIDLFDPAKERPGLKAELGLADRFVVMFAGLLGIAQGLDAVLDAAARLQGDPRFAVCFLGEGPRKAHLRARAEQEGIANVVFLPAVPTDRAAAYLLAADALLVPLARDEILQQFVPSKLYDFLACARPVIVMARGESRDIAERSGGGVSVDPEDASGLANAARSLAAMSPDERAAMGERGRRYVLAHHVRQVTNERLVELLREMEAR